MTNETKILTALLDPNHTDHYLMHITVGSNMIIRFDNVTNAVIIEHGDKRMMVAMGKEDSLDGLIPFMKAKKGVQEFDTYREPLTPTKGGEDGKGIPSVFGYKIMERQSPMVLRPVDTIRYRMFDDERCTLHTIRGKGNVSITSRGNVSLSINDRKAKIFSALDPHLGQPHTTVADHPFMTDDTLDCGCIDRDQEKVGCESCHRISCLDCHEIDSTPVKVADWKCKEGFGCSMEEEE